MSVYATECAAVKKKTTLAVNAEFTKAESRNGHNPLEIYAPWSRFVLSVIEGGGTSAGVNIPVRDVPMILLRSDYAQRKQLDHITSVASTVDKHLGKAYTVRLSSGAFKGKTPAEILLDDPDSGKAALNTQYSFLAQNLSKYPRNQDQMDAIMEAAQLLKEGNLVPRNASATIPIYDIPMKSLTNRAKSNGKCFVYTVNIHWEVGEQCPVVIRLENYYAFVESSAGMIRVNPQSKEDYKLQAFRTTDSEWAYACSRMKEIMHDFETTVARDCFEDSRLCSDAAREKANIPRRA